MATYSMKPMTDDSWLLCMDGDRIALVTASGDQVRVIGKIASGTYPSIQELEETLGSRITIEQPPEPAAEKEIGSVGGYPVKHDQWHNITTDPVPSYTRSASSKIRYAAGYYGFRFSNGWTASFCPKLSTLAEHEYIGPFTTKLEMQHRISAVSKTINV